MCDKFLFVFFSVWPHWKWHETVVNWSNSISVFDDKKKKYATNSRVLRMTATWLWTENIHFLSNIFDNIFFVHWIRQFWKNFTICQLNGNSGETKKMNGKNVHRKHQTWNIYNKIAIFLLLFDCLFQRECHPLKV